MPSQPSELVSFITQWDANIAAIVQKMEELIYQDPASSIVKARLLVEEILKQVFQFENIVPQFNWSLNDKMVFLSNKNILSGEIQKLFHTVRLTGNKAAHTANFEDLSEAIKLHKTIYFISKWFYETYMTVQTSVPAYEYPKPTSENSEEIKNLKDNVKRIMEMIRIEQEITPNKFAVSVKSIRNASLLISDLSEGQSYLLRELRRLKDSSREAIENSNSFSKYKEYLHIERKVQKDLENSLRKRQSISQASLILLCGSVGDGKSHLLAYLKENKPELLEGYTIFNDATESFSPSKDAMETLQDILGDFSDERIEKSDKKVILAINMGILHNFISYEHNNFTYGRLENFVENSGLFSSEKITACFSEEQFDLISFSDYHPYELTQKGVESHFFSTMLERVFSFEETNPFYLAYKEDISRNYKTMMHENYLLLQNSFVQKQIVQLVIRAIIKYKLVISARAFLNFIADLVVPDFQTSYDFMDTFQRMEQAVPSLLFKRRERSFILKAIYDLDPMHTRSSDTDKLIIELNTLSDWSNITDIYILDVTARKWLNFYKNTEEERFTHSSFALFSEFILRLAFLTNEEFSTKTKPVIYYKYIESLYALNVGDRKGIRMLYEEVKEVILKWKNSPAKDYVYISKQTESIRIAQKLNLNPDISHIQTLIKEKLETFKASLSVAYRCKNQLVNLEIDYALYELLQKVLSGYCPNKKDEEDAIKFVEFVEKLMNYGDKNKELLVHYPQDSRIYKFYKDDFSAFVFEKE
ncbi:DNA phosphorothioation-dependent restriction protein DptF [Paenibacillus sp. sgz500958]|uniref:DNA phosphorothioation-dependent restriction protein DptF n=1 Tax=Paenibacillus sp. sgz500958 TaxID=3242475 RepID=UPI0036D32531